MISVLRIIAGTVIKTCVWNYKHYFAMTAANNKTHTVKGKEKRRKKKHTTYNRGHKKEKHKTH